jgi:hypothetical protein
MTAQYPNAVVSDINIPRAINNFATTLNGSLGASGDNTAGSGIAVVSTAGMPTAGVVTIEDGEIVTYTGISGNNLTGYTRGADGTTAATHVSGVSVAVNHVALHHNSIQDEVEAIENDLVNGIRLNAFNNLLVNPGFEIWQRGASFASPITDAFTADKWKVSYSGAPSFTITKDTSAPNINLGSASLSSQISAVGGSTSYFIRQFVENYQDFIGKTVSFSIWVKSTVPGIKAFISNATPATSFSVAHSGGTAWQRLTCTYTVPVGSAFLEVGIGFADISPSLSQFWLDSAMLVNGSKPMEYQPFQSADDWSRCLRYYESNQFSLRAYAGSTNAQYSPVVYRAIKASLPSVTVVNGTIANVTSVGTTAPFITGFTLSITPTIVGEYGIGLSTLASWAAEVV